jgi:hypothetical protein
MNNLQVEKGGPWEKIIGHRSLLICHFSLCFAFLPWVSVTMGSKRQNGNDK